MVLNEQLNKYRLLLRKLKSEYRAITGFESDSNWSKFHSCLEELNILSPKLSDSQNRDNVLFYARLRQEIPKTSVSLKGAILFYLQEKKFTDALNGRRLTGGEIIQYLKIQGVEATKPTITNWFKSVGGYRKKAEYLPEETLKVLYRAAIYKAAKETKSKSK